jgi:hypothetical protein
VQSTHCPVATLQSLPIGVQSMSESQGPAGEVDLGRRPLSASMIGREPRLTGTTITSQIVIASRTRKVLMGSGLAAIFAVGIAANQSTALSLVDSSSPVLDAWTLDSPQA